MTLKEYLQSHGMKQRHMAKLCGVSHARISHLVNGMGRPSAATIEAVARATNGAVQPNDWFPEQRNTEATQ